MKKIILLSLIVLILLNFNTYGENRKMKKPLIIAHYMAWYQTPDISGSWGFWQINRGNVSKKYWRFPEIRNYNGWRQVSSVYYPIIGPYDSGDPDLCEYHILQAHLAGIDGFICDWYGENHHYDDIAYRTMRDKAAELGFFKVAICWEDQAFFPPYQPNFTSRNQAVELGKKNIQYLEKEWFNSKAYLKIDGNPVLANYAWGSPGDSVKDIWFSANEWQKILAAGKSNPILLHDWHEHYWRYDDFSKYYSLLPWGDIYHGNKVTNKKYWNLAEDLYDDKKIEILTGTVLPGFDNRGCGGWGTGSAIGITNRYGGKKFIDTWEDVIKHNPDFIQIATWNDLNEGGTIEPVREGILNKKDPAEGYGYRELETVQKYAKKLKKIEYDKLALRVPAMIYLCRKINKQMYKSTDTKFKSNDKKINKIRKILLDNNSKKAMDMIEKLYKSFPKKYLNNPDYIINSDKKTKETDIWGNFAKWGIQACDPIIGPRFLTSYSGESYYPYENKKDILCIRPMRKDVPVTLTRRVKIPKNGAELKLSVSPEMSKSPESGFDILIQINDENKLQETINSSNTKDWKDISIDMNDLKGQYANINIRISDNSNIPWENSHCFISNMLITNLDKPNLKMPIRFTAWAEPWNIETYNSENKPDFRNKFYNLKHFPIPGKQNILTVYPKSKKIPAVITRKLWLPEKETKLYFALSPDMHRGQRTGYRFEIVVNDKKLYNKKITSETVNQDWLEETIALKKFKDKPVVIECRVYHLENIPNPYCFISNMFIKDVDPDPRLPEAKEKIYGWAKGWQIFDCDPNKGPVVKDDFTREAEYPHPGRTEVLVLHPLSSTKPCYLTKTITVPKTGGNLSLYVSANAAQTGTADFEFDIEINDKNVLSKIIEAGNKKSPDNWRKITVVLTPYSGKKIKIKIINSAGGKNPWAWEHCFLSEVKFSWQ